LIRIARVRYASSGGQILPGVGEVATSASVVGRVTRDKVLGRHDNVDLSLGVNGKPVSEGLSGSESPA